MFSKHLSMSARRCLRLPVVSGSFSNNYQFQRNSPAIAHFSHRFYSCTNPRNEEKTNKDQAVVKPPTMQEKFKKLWKNYGLIAVGTYLTIYGTTLGSLFLAVDYDILNAASVGLDPAMAVEKFCHVVEMFTGNHSFPEYVRDHPHVGKFAIAWVMTKFTEPLRLGITIAAVPKVAKLLGRHVPDDHQQQPAEKK